MHSEWAAGKKGRRELDTNAMHGCFYVVEQISAPDKSLSEISEWLCN